MHAAKGMMVIPCQFILAIILAGFPVLRWVAELQLLTLRVLKTVTERGLDVLITLTSVL